MRLTVLGGSAAIPNAGSGCAGFLVQEGETRVVLDLGPGTIGELRRHVDLADVDAVVISHLHVDHVLDVVALRHGLAFTPEPPTEPLTVWLPPEGEALLRATLAPLEAWMPAGRFDGAVTLQEYDPSRALVFDGSGRAVMWPPAEGGRDESRGHRVGGSLATFGSDPLLTLTFHRTVHDVPCWAIRADGATGTVIYGADGGPGSDLAAFARGADLLIAEATLIAGGGEPERGSLTASEAGELATRSNAKRLVLTHVWQEHGVERQREAAATSYDGPISVARPGLVLEV